MAGKIKPGRIAAVVSELGQEIAGGLLPPGAALPPEHELEARFGVSRGVVREAMKMLGAKGLVQVRPRLGTRVCPQHEWAWFDRDLIAWLSAGGIRRELLLAFEETRMVIEPAAAALAAERATAAEKQAIAAASLAMAQNREDRSRAIAADKEFHLAVLDAAHNPVLQSLRGFIEAILTGMFDVTVDAFAGNLEVHRAVAEAIGRGDARQARQAMEKLLVYTEKFLRA